MRFCGASARTKLAASPCGAHGRTSRRGHFDFVALRVLRGEKQAPVTPYPPLELRVFTRRFAEFRSFPVVSSDLIFYETANHVLQLRRIDSCVRQGIIELGLCPNTIQVGER
jgi:hypothetical protein